MVFQGPTFRNQNNKRQAQCSFLFLDFFVQSNLKFAAHSHLLAPFHSFLHFLAVANILLVLLFELYASCLLQDCYNYLAV